MKILFTLILAWFVVPVFAQTWERVKIDSVVAVNLPHGHTSRDTLGQKIISAQTIFGNIQVVITPDNPRKTPDIEKKKHLLKYYDNYIKSVESSSKGKISDERDTLLGDLHVKDFTLELDGNAGKELRKFRILHENCATYTFQFFYNELQKNVSEEECKKFFSSIHVANDPTLASQYTAETATPKDQKNRTWLYIGIGAGVLLVLVVILMMRRKKAATHL